MWRKRAPEGDSKIAKRLALLPEADLVSWGDQALYSTGRYLTAYQRERLPEYLDEARLGAETLLGVVEEIKRRQAP